MKVTSRISAALLLASSAATFAFSLTPVDGRPPVSQWDLAPGWSVSATFSVWLIVVLSTIFLIFGGWRIENRAPSPRRFWGLYSLGLLFFMSLASGFAHLSIAAMQNVVALGVFTLAIALGLTWPRPKAFFRTLIISGCVFATVSTMELLLGLPLIHNQSVGQLLIIPIALVTGLWTANGGNPVRAWHPIGILVAQFLLVTGVVATGARMPTAIAIFLAATLFYKRKWPLLKKITAWFAGMVVLVAWTWLLISSSDFLTKRLHEPPEALSFGPSEDSVNDVSEVADSFILPIPNTNGRLVVWESLVARETDLLTFLFGRGTGEAVQASETMSNPHSEFIRFYFDLGLFGLLLFGIFLLWLVFQGFSSAATQLENKTLAPALGFAIGSLAVTNSILLYTDFGLIAGLAIGMALRNRPVTEAGELQGRKLR